MKSRTWLIVILALLVVAGAVTYVFIVRDASPATTTGGGSTEPYGPLLDARDALLKGAQEIELELAVDVPKGSESDNPDHQEISAEGVADLAAGDADLLYDFQGLNNAAGFLGHFDTMEVRYIDGTGYLDIFNDGPRWVSIQPGDASKGDVHRLRDAMLTTPMILSGLLEAAATSPTGSDELSREVNPANLASSKDELAAGVGEAFTELDVDLIVVTVELDDGYPSKVEAIFEYMTGQGKLDVHVTYTLTSSQEPPSIETPAEDDIRAFSEFFGG